MTFDGPFSMDCESPDSHPPDEAPGPLGGSVERGINEVSNRPDEVRHHSRHARRMGSALLLLNWWKIFPMSQWCL